MTVTQSTLLLGKYKRIVGSCPRVLRVSLSCFPGVLLNIRPWEAWEGMLGILVLDLRTMIVVYWVSVCEMYGAGWVSVCEMYGASWVSVCEMYGAGSAGLSWTHGCHTVMFWKKLQTVISCESNSCVVKSCDMSSMSYMYRCAGGRSVSYTYRCHGGLSVSYTYRCHGGLFVSYT